MCQTCKKFKSYKLLHTLITFINETAVELHVYRKGPPNRGGVGHAGVRWVIQGWGGSHRGGVGHAGVGWVIQGSGRSQRGWVGHAGVGRSCCSGEDHAGWGK